MMEFQMSFHRFPKLLANYFLCKRYEGQRLTTDRNRKSLIKNKLHDRFAVWMFLTFNNNTVLSAPCMK